MKKIYLSPLFRGAILLSAFLLLPVLCQGQKTSDAGMSANTGKGNSLFPLKGANQTNRYLVDQNNLPFFWLGDAAWSLIAQLNREDVDFYLDNRKAKGFSVILVSLIEHKFCTKAPSNYYGELPFTGRNFTSPNLKYFEHADYVIESAARRNILVLLAPLYLGYDCMDEGWCTEVKAASNAELYNWGKYLGKRYSKFSNILWIIGGDTDPSPVKGKILEMVRGIRENDSIHLFTAHNRPEMMAVTPWKDEPWLTVNNVYSYDSVLYPHFKTAFEIKPLMPYFLVESAYENEHNSTPQELRSQAYQALLSGAMGHIFGNCPIWHFGSFKSWCSITDWKTELNNSGSQGMDYFRRLFLSRAWNSLVPDFENAIITSDKCRWGEKDHVSAARTTNGNTIIAYLPSGKPINSDLSKVSGRRARCWWYNPSNGNATLIGTFKTSGNKIFRPPSENDWVLVIDNDAENLPVPGRIK